MDTKISAEGVNVFYGEAHALKNVSMQFMRNEVTALTGTIRLRKIYLLHAESDE